jgi:thiamine-phosphate pyrophosphorylase
LSRSDIYGTLCLVTDRSFSPPDRFLDIVDAAIAGGATMVQLRDKEPSRSTREVYEDGRSLHALCSERKVPLIVNDRLDLAMALEADGVHLGQGDLPVAVARRLWPEGAIFGVSASTLAEAVDAEREGGDYIGFGAVFPTATKREARDGGLEELARVVSACALPVLAIGGISVAGVPRVMASGCAGIAVISAVWNSPDPRGASAALASAVSAAIAPIAPAALASSRGHPC